MMNRLSVSDHASIAHIAVAHKREFQTSASFRYGHVKKRRLLNGAHSVQSFDGFSSMCNTSIQSIGSTDVETRPRFKAKPVPKTHYVPSIIVRGSSRPLTSPSPPQLTESNRSRGSSVAESDSVQFHALPLNRSILEKPDFVPQRPGFHTVPQEFRLSQSSSNNNSLEVPQQNGFVQFKARPVPDFSVVTLPQRREFVPTQPQTFHLETEVRGVTKTAALHEKYFARVQAEELQNRPLTPYFHSPSKGRPKTPQQTSFCAFNVQQLAATFRSREESSMPPGENQDPAVWGEMMVCDDSEPMDVQGR